MANATSTKLDEQAASAAWARALEEDPLYRAVELDLGSPCVPYNLFPHAITRDCAGCGGETTWIATNRPALPMDVARYECVRCARNTVSFWLFVQYDGQFPTKFTVRKIGQWPPYSTAIPKGLAVEGQELEFYKKGLTSLGHAYGLGALAYFRRVVEGATVDLLGLLREAAELDGDGEHVAAIDAATREQNEAEKLRLAVAAVPPYLRRYGQNPLATLHDEYSKGIHGGTDEECLSTALGLRTAFEYLFKNLKVSLDEAREYARQLQAYRKQKSRE